MFDSILNVFLSELNYALLDAFRVPLVIQLTDDENCLWKNISVEESMRLARENAKDIIACGFDISRTFIFSDFKYVGRSLGSLGSPVKIILEKARKEKCQPVIQIPQFVTDSAKDLIKNKIYKYAFSGGQDSIENHRKYGANLEVDIPIKYLGFFLEDDAELERIRAEYGAGRMLTGEVKKRLIEVLTDIVERHRRARAAVTEEE
ncbi:Tryptophan--tRNA ligase, cytoplasmic-like protein [Drosera capensis]